MLRPIAKLVLVLAVFAFMGAFLLNHIAETQEIPVRQIYIEGSPRIMQVGSAEWVEFTIDTVIHNGDRVKTLKGEAIELSFAADADKNVIRIDEESDVFIKIGRSSQSVEILNGAAVVMIGKLPEGSTFKVKTPTAVSGVRGTGWRSAYNGTSSTFSAFENSVYVKGIGQDGNEMKDELTVGGGWKTTVGKFESPSPIEKLSAEEIGRWRAWKENVLQRIRESGGTQGPDKSGMERADRVASHNLDRMQGMKDNVLEKTDMERIEKRLESVTEETGAAVTSGD